MKKRTKIGLGISVAVFGVLALSGCTSSFCSPNDQAHMLYAYDNGVTKYFDEGKQPQTETVTKLVISGYTVYKDVSYNYNNGGLTKITTDAVKTNNLEVPSIDYWAALDDIILEKMTPYLNFSPVSTGEKTPSQIISEGLELYGYFKFSPDSSGDKSVLWDNWNILSEEARIKVGDIDKCPTTDFVNFYKSQMNTYITNYRSCITTVEGKYGYYGLDDNKTPVFIEAKDYGYGWSKGFFEGLLVWPLAALVDRICEAFAPGVGNGLNGTNGWAQFLAIVIVTLLVRTIMFLLTFKQTQASAKMTELQPEITKIQNKYPNANSSQSEKARMAGEMQALYKKHKINPFASILVLIVQFPVFICVWGALSGSAWLSTGSFCNLNLSDSISSALFNGANWSNGSAVTALILFLLMAGTQVVSMLLPQWLQKKRDKNSAKLGKNPNKKAQDNKMKWFTYIMMIMIIIMGFSLVSAMGVYWLVGAIFSIAQTLITQAVTHKRAKEKKI